MQTQRIACNSSTVIHARQQRPLCALTVDVAPPLTTRTTYVSKEARLALFGKAKEQVDVLNMRLWQHACPHLNISLPVICDSVGVRATRHTECVGAYCCQLEEMSFMLLPRLRR